jgi:uncharacterized damage-inducible protein DinB
MWHGPALAQVLEGVTHDQAAAHPIAGVHSIWEIALHAAAWAEIARARLKGERTGDPTVAEDWPPVTATGADDWQRAIERVGASHRELAAAVRQMTDDALEAKVPGLEYTVATLVHGVVEHSTYHGGQMMLLRKTFG